MEEFEFGIGELSQFVIDMNFATNRVDDEALKSNERLFVDRP
jgi:hypothetical protein